MTTDSRSILSFVRHDYFRRILASFLDEENERNDMELSDKDFEILIKRICYENAKSKINGRG
jgi:glucuronate isomerase